MYLQQKQIFRQLCIYCKGHSSTVALWSPVLCSNQLSSTHPRCCLQILFFYKNLLSSCRRNSVTDEKKKNKKRKKKTFMNPEWIKKLSQFGWQHFAYTSSEDETQFVEYLGYYSAFRKYSVAVKKHWCKWLNRQIIRMHIKSAYSSLALCWYFFGI